MNSTPPLFDNEGHTGSKWLCQLLVAEGAIGVLGNLLVCFVILRVNFLHNMTNYLLVNLAVADMLLCLQEVVAFLTYSDYALVALVPTSSGGRELFCRLLVSRFLNWALSYASAYSLCLVTLERYVAIVYPLHYAMTLTAKRMKTLVALIWVISFLSSLPLSFTIKASTDPDKACSDIQYPNLAFLILLTVYSFLFGYFLPITLMCLASYKMQRTLKRQANALRLEHARAAAYDLVIARQRLVTTLTIVLGAIIVLWTPDYITVFLCLFRTDTRPLPYCHLETNEYIGGIFDFIFYFNSVINPIIYELKYKKFRQGLKVAFFKRRGNNRIGIEMVPF